LIISSMLFVIVGPLPSAPLAWLREECLFINLAQESKTDRTGR
jgi:hypothetical protein